MIKKTLKERRSAYTSYENLKKTIEKNINQGFIAHWYEFLRINEIGTQPFMEFSIYDKFWYTKEEIFAEIDKLEAIIKKNHFSKDEIYFADGYSKKSPLWIITCIIQPVNIKETIKSLIKEGEIIKGVLLYYTINDSEKVYVNQIKCDISDEKNINIFDEFIADLPKFYIKDRNLWIWIVSIKSLWFNI